MIVMYFCGKNKLVRTRSDAKVTENVTIHTSVFKYTYYCCRVAANQRSNVFETFTSCTTSLRSMLQRQTNESYHHENFDNRVMINGLTKIRYFLFIFFFLFVWFVSSVTNECSYVNNAYTLSRYRRYCTKWLIRCRCDTGSSA